MEYNTDKRGYIKLLRYSSCDIKNYLRHKYIISTNINPNFSIKLNKSIKN